MNNVIQLHFPEPDCLLTAHIWADEQFALFVLSGNHGMTLPANDNEICGQQKGY